MKNGMFHYKNVSDTNTDTLPPRGGSPEGNKVRIHKRRDEKGEHKLPDLCVPLHVPPPDLGQERLSVTRQKVKREHKTKDVNS